MLRIACGRREREREGKKKRERGTFLFL